jgi:ubiquinone/menaquinone biosynthesis C-methylase UbiE
MDERVPLPVEPIADPDAVVQYDKGARLYMMPEYRYFVRKVLGKGIRSGRLLDVGTGSGRLAIELARAGGGSFDIVALDISENMIARARENAALCGVAGRIKFVVGTAAALPFSGDSFDLVISYASLHHWFHPGAVFNEIARVVKPSGHAIIRDNKRVYQNPLWRAAIWLVTRFMNRRHRENWPKAILASYTVPEVREILNRAGLGDYRVHSDFVYIDLCIESPAPGRNNGGEC